MSPRPGVIILRAALPSADDVVPSELIKRALAARHWAVRHLLEAENATRAIELGQRVVKDTERLLGTHHLDTIAARNTLAYAYESAGQLDVAIALFESNAEEHQQLLGSNHPRTLASVNNLAYAHQSAGHLDHAANLFESVLAGRTRTLGSTHPATLRSRNNLAGAYMAAGKAQEAIPLFASIAADRATYSALTTQELCAVVTTSPEPTAKPESWNRQGHSSKQSSPIPAERWALSTLTH